MVKKYLKLTKDQKERGVYFSSEFIVPQQDRVIHEITHKEYRENPEDAIEKERRLRDDRFFRGWGHDRNNDITHEIRS